MSFRWTRASWPAIAKVACALVFFHMCTQKWSPWACEDETEPDSWERIGNSWLHNLFSLSTKKFCLNGRRGIWSRFLDIQRYGTKESRNRLTPWRSAHLMHLGHAGTYYTWASYMQSTRATSPAPSDVLRGPWPPLCARNFQAVTVLPSPPRSNANFLPFFRCSFFNPGERLLGQKISSALNLKCIAANALRSAEYWSSSSARGWAGLPAGSICWANASTGVTQTQSADRLLSQMPLPSHPFLPMIFLKSLRSTLGCWCWEQTSSWFRAQHANSPQVFSWLIFFFNF